MSAGVICDIMKKAIYLHTVVGKRSKDRGDRVFEQDYLLLFTQAKSISEPL